VFGGINFSFLVGDNPVGGVRQTRPIRDTVKAPGEIRRLFFSVPDGFFRAYGTAPTICFIGSPVARQPVFGFTQHRLYFSTPRAEATGLKPQPLNNSQVLHEVADDHATYGDRLSGTNPIQVQTACKGGPHNGRNAEQMVQSYCPATSAAVSVPS
jgi:hypothetical protein